MSKFSVYWEVLHYNTPHFITISQVLIIFHHYFNAKTSFMETIILFMQRKKIYILKLYRLTNCEMNLGSSGTGVDFNHSPALVSIHAGLSSFGYSAH